MKNKSLLRYDVKVAILFVLLTFAVASMAQTSLGTIAGVVTDPQGAVIMNATVTAVSNATGEKHTTTSNSIGAYRIESVGPGPYTISVKADKFSELKIAGAIVSASVTTTVNAELKVGVSETVVTVETQGELLHTEDGAITHNISSQEIASIPIAGLNAISLVLTEPGVVQPSGRESFTNGVGFSVNGSRPRGNNFLLEGFDNNDAAIQGQALQVNNLEATKEVAIQTSSYTAEFGHGGGSVTNQIYKSGSNAWHGSVYDLIRNSSLDSATAQDKFNGSPKAKSRENTYGFTVGGPIKHDKIFIFGAVQWDKQRQAANGATLVAPTPAGFATLQALAAGNPRVTNYLAALGSVRGNPDPSAQGFLTIPVSSGPSVTAGRVQRLGVGEPSNNVNYVAKGDWTFSANDTVTLRYTYTKNDLTPDFFNFNNLLPCCDTQQGGAAHNGGLAYTHSFSPRVINEFRASYGRIGFDFEPTPATAANPVANGPTFTIAQLTGFGIPGNIPQGRFHNTYQYQDSVSWLKGNHSFKFGTDIARILVRDGIPFNSRGTLAYASGGGFSGLANFIDDFGGNGGSANLTFGSPILRPRYFFQNYFAQDTWKLRSNLTLSLGIRYENAGTPENSMPFPAIDHITGVFDPNFFTTGHPQQSDNNNFAPRVSVAYTPHFWGGLFGHDKTVIRAGFGEYFDNIFTNIVDNSGGSSPNAVSKSIASGSVGRGQAALSGQFGALNPTPTQNVAVTSIVDNIISPEIYQWNFDIERELGAKFVLTSSYVGSRGVHLLVNDQFNQIVNPLTGARLNPLRNSWTIRDNGGDSIYHALEMKLDRRFSNGFLFRTSYTFSKLIDTGSEVFQTTGNSSFPENLTNRALDRGPSAFDRRHRLVFTYVYDIPKFRNDSNFGAKVLGHIVNGWEIAGTAAFQSGAPFTVSDGFDNNGDATASDRPFFNNAGAPVTAWGFLTPSGGVVDGPYTQNKAALSISAANLTQINTFFPNGIPFLNGTLDRHLATNPTNDPSLWTGTPVTAASFQWLVPVPNTGFGTLGRNSFFVPWNQTWTFGLQRTVNLHSERHQFVFRMEMLNPFNHPNTGNPASTNLNATSLSFAPGSCLSSACTTTAGPIPTSNFFNTVSTIAGQRNIRFWLKYQF